MSPPNKSTEISDFRGSLAITEVSQKYSINYEKTQRKLIKLLRVLEILFNLQNLS